jgi:hypothetical protein
MAAVMAAADTVVVMVATEAMEATLPALLHTELNVDGRF